MRTPEEIIGHDALLQLTFEGYEVVRAQSLLPADASQFDQFWAAYPRKTAKPAALKAYNAAIKRGAKHLRIMAGLTRFVASRPDPQFTPHASTWLNQDRWNDVPLKRSGVAGMMDDLRQEIADDERRAGEEVSDPDLAGGLSLLRQIC